MSSAVDVGHDYAAGNAVEGDCTLYGGINAALAPRPHFVIAHRRNCFENSHHSLLARVAVRVQGRVSYAKSNLNVRLDVCGSIQEVSINHVSCLPVLDF